MKTDIEDIVSEYIKLPAETFEKEGFRRALNLFHSAAERVPAYKEFLKKNKIHPHKIKTYKEFQQVPPVNKKNYLRAYPLKDLCWDRKFNNLYILSSSSGSTGQPFLWPRGEQQEIEGAFQFELIFKEIFQADKLSTLYLNCFSMGTWIAGPFVLACAEYISRKGYPVLTVTPGLDNDVIFTLFKNLASQFDQIVISGYPPYIKDILDMGREYDVDWKKYKIKFLFAAEGFSERWREYVHKKVGATNIFCDSINMYGTADAAIMSNETPLTTAIRRLIADKPNLIKEFFGDSRLPTLTQYDPRLKFFEEENREIIFTTNSGIPLIRYNIGDTGGVYSFDAMEKKLSAVDVPLRAFMNKSKLSRYSWKLPFVYIFGRTDFTISFYGLLIYPENVKFGLENDELSRFITGKFVMSVEFDNKNDPYFLIRVELKRKIKPSESLSTKIQTMVVSGLKKINSEYSRLHEVIKERATPVINLIENGNVDHFRPGTKQRWVKKA